MCYYVRVSCSNLLRVFLLAIVWALKTWVYFDFDILIETELSSLLVLSEICHLVFLLAQLGRYFECFAFAQSFVLFEQIFVLFAALYECIVCQSQVVKVLEEKMEKCKTNRIKSNGLELKLTWFSFLDEILIEIAGNCLHTRLRANEKRTEDEEKQCNTSDFLHIGFEAKFKLLFYFFSNWNQSLKTKINLKQFEIKVNVRIEMRSDSKSMY